MSGWKVSGEVLVDDDLDDGFRVYQKVIFNQDIVLKAIRTRIILFNNPTFTDLFMEIYSLDGTTPRKLLHTSTNVRTKADLLTLNSRVVETYFDFDLPTFKGTDAFAVILRANGYTYSTSSHIAWKKGWPDPIYRTNVDSGLVDKHRSPYDIHFISAPLNV